MKKDVGVKPYLFPMPVLMVATYNDDGSVDVMNVAWGGICNINMISLSIAEAHATTKNIKKRKAFTVGIADEAHVKEADFFGMASANLDRGKFARTGLTSVKSTKVDAPIIQEFPVTLECQLVEAKMEIYGFHILGEILGTLADEAVIDEEGHVLVEKVHAIAYDPSLHGYYKIGRKIGQAWADGKSYMTS